MEFRCGVASSALRCVVRALVRFGVLKGKIYAYFRLELIYSCAF